MFDVVIVDRSAEERQRLSRRVIEAIEEFARRGEVLPALNVISRMPEELQFCGHAGVLILGPGCATQDSGEVQRARRLFPNVPLLVALSAQAESLLLIDRLARAGVQDLITEDTPGRLLVQKLVLCSQRGPVTRSGTLVAVSSAKGGAGVTSFVASIGELLINHGRGATLIDCDTDTQDLTRFLGVSPAVNENLQSIIDGRNAPHAEFVAECALPVWSEEPRLKLVSPPVSFPEGGAGIGGKLPALLSFFEVLDKTSEFVVVDLAAAPRAVQDLVSSIADIVVYLVEADLAAIYPAAKRITQLRNLLGESAKLRIIEREAAASSVSAKTFIEELALAALIAPEELLTQRVPYEICAARWPGSGGTALGLGGRRMAAALEIIAGQLGLIAPPAGVFQPGERLLQPARWLREVTNKLIRSRYDEGWAELRRPKPLTPQIGFIPAAAALGPPRLAGSAGPNPLNCMEEK